MAWYDSIIDFATNNPDKIIDAGSKLISAMNKGNTTNQLAGLLANQEQQNFNNTMANSNAYNDWLKNVYEPGVAANRAASQKAAAARSAAARRTEANRVAANKKAQAQITKGFKESNVLYKPYIEAGAKAAPVAAETYTQGMKGLGELQKMMMSPDMLALLGDIRNPGTAVNLGKLPGYLK